MQDNPINILASPRRLAWRPNNHFDSIHFARGPNNHFDLHRLDSCRSFGRSARAMGERCGMMLAVFHHGLMKVSEYPFQIFRVFRGVDCILGESILHLAWPHGPRAKGGSEIGVLFRMICPASPDCAGFRTSQSNSNGCGIGSVHGGEGG